MCEGDWEKFNDDNGAFPKWWSIENIFTTDDGFKLVYLMCGVCDTWIKAVIPTPAQIKLLTENKGGEEE